MIRKHCLFLFSVFIISLFFTPLFVSAQNSGSTMSVNFVVDGCDFEDIRLSPGQCSDSGDFYCSKESVLMDTKIVEGACFIEGGFGGNSCCPEGFVCDSKSRLCEVEKSFNILYWLLGLLVLAVIVYFVYKGQNKTNKKTKPKKIKKIKKRR